MAIGIKRFNWVRTRTAWEQTQAWNERRAAARERFNSAAASARSAFDAARTNAISGLGELAAQQAVARVKAAADAKLKALQTQLNEVA